MIIFVNKMNVRSSTPQALSAVPDKFREELRKAESKQKDTKFMFQFVNIYNEYFNKSLPQNPDLYDSMIPMIEFDDFVVRIYNLYTRYHGTPIPVSTEKRDSEAFCKIIVSSLQCTTQKSKTYSMKNIKEQ